MKKRFAAAAAVTAFLLTGCRSEQTEYEPLPTLETVPKYSVTSSTYTGTTVEFYYSTTREPPTMGTVSDNMFDIADTAAAESDFLYPEADRGYAEAETAVVESDIPDRAMTETVSFDRDIPEADAADIGADNARPEYVSADTGEYYR